MSYIKNIVFVFLLYLYIYNPYLYIGGKSWGTLKILYLLIPFIFFSKDIFKFVNLLWKEAVLLLIICLYTTTWWFDNGEFSHVRSSIVNFIELILVPAFLMFVFFKFFKNKNIVHYLVIVAIIGCIISVILFLSPSLSMIVRSYMVSVDDRMINIEYRGFGITDGNTFAYPLFLGTAICYNFSHKTIIPNTILFPLCLFSIAINARIGFLPIILSVCFLFLNKKENNKRIVPLLFFCLVALIIVFPILLNIKPETFEWTFSFFEQISDYFFGTQYSDSKSTTFDALFGRMLVWPDTFSEWIFGRGFSIFGRANLSTVASSDVGYILQLNYGGIIYMLLWCLFFIVLLSKIRGNKYVFYVILFMLLIANIKGSVCGTNDFLRGVILYGLYMVHMKSLTQNNQYRGYEIL